MDKIIHTQIEIYDISETTYMAKIQFVTYESQIYRGKQFLREQMTYCKQLTNFNMNKETTGHRNECE